MLQHPRAQVVAFADIQQAIVRTKEAVDTRRLRNLGDALCRQGRRNRRLLQLIDDSGVAQLRRNLCAAQRQKLPGRFGIAERTMAGVIADTKTAADGIQTVTFQPGVELTRPAHGAQPVGIKTDVDPGKLGFQKAVVKAGVVGNKNPAAEQCHQFFSNRREGRRTCKIVAADAGELLDEIGQLHARINQALPALTDDAVVDQQHADLDHAIMAGVGAGGFQIDHRQRPIQWCGQRHACVIHHAQACSAGQLNNRCCSGKYSASMIDRCSSRCSTWA